MVGIGAQLIEPKAAGDDKKPAVKMGAGLEQMRLLNSAGAGHLSKIIGFVTLAGERQAKPPEARETRR